MNISVTASAKNPQVFNVIHLMRWINVVDIKFSISLFTNKTFVGIKGESSSSINPRTFPIVRIPRIFSFNSMKSFLFARIGTKLRVPASFTDAFLAAFLAINDLFSRGILAGIQKAFSRAKSPSFIFRPSYIGWSLCKNLRAIKTRNFDFSRSRFFITLAATKFSSILGKSNLACGTSFHMPIIPLAMANVNHKQPAEVTNEGL